MDGSLLRADGDFSSFFLVKRWLFEGKNIEFIAQ